MTFRVIVLPGAESDIADAADWIPEHSPIVTARWLEGIRAAINTLSGIPLRCPVAGDDFGRDVIVRQLFYGRRRNRTASRSRLPKARCTSCACGMGRAYLSISDSTAKMISRSYTWRVDQGYLSAPDKHYTRPLAFDHLSPQALAKCRVVCLFDIKRGFHDLLFAAGDGLPSIADMLAAIPRDKVLVIRTSDPTRFARLLSPTGSVRCPVVFLCPLDEIANDSLRTSGTWSDIWRHTYRYLSEISGLRSRKSSD